MDETMIGRHNGILTSRLKLRWAFGMVCRQTQIPIIFYVVRKTHWLLSTISKAYTAPGSIIFTDAHSSYCTLQNATSKLTQYGFYHFWINHSAEYVHTKYPFVTTAAIERQWLHMKSLFKCLTHQSEIVEMERCLQTYCLRTMLKNFKIYSFTLRRVKEFHSYYLQKYLDRQIDGDSALPFMRSITQIHGIVKERGYLWRTEAEREHAIQALNHQNLFEPGLDYFYIDAKISKLKSDTELHPSIVTLARDPFRFIPLNEHSKTRVVCAKLDRDKSSHDREIRLKED